MQRQFNIEADVNNDNQQLPDITRSSAPAGASDATTQLTYETSATGRANEVYKFVYRADLYSYPIANQASGNALTGGDYRTFYRKNFNTVSCPNRAYSMSPGGNEGYLNSITWQKIICYKILVLQNY